MWSSDSVTDATGLQYWKCALWSAIGSLLYLPIATRPDIAFAISRVAKYSAKPTKQHWIAVKHIFRYFKGTVNYSLQYRKVEQTDCVGFSDADWAGDIDDCKSTSGYLFQLSGAAISWRSKKQRCVALCTAGAEYMALASAAREAMWLRQIVTDLKKSPTSPTVIYEDNLQKESAISRSIKTHRNKILLHLRTSMQQTHRTEILPNHCYDRRHAY